MLVLGLTHKDYRSMHTADRQGERHGHVRQKRGTEVHPRGYYRHS